MSAYMQMGHHTENLVGEVDLEDFAGVVLSPLNRDFKQMQEDIKCFRDRNIKDVVLDPQLYYPRTERARLRRHRYFPDDLDTADTASLGWWRKLNKSIVEYVKKIDADSVTSPAIEPKKWTDDYYHVIVESSNNLRSIVPKDKKCLTTLMVSVAEMSVEEQPLRVASLSSEIETDGYYIVFVSDLEPRREYRECEEIYGALTLVSELSRVGKEIFISFAGSDMLLFKAAGADNCGTGKFFNLRRFTKSRYEEPSAGGGQLPYWFEHSLLAFIREPDILRIEKNIEDKMLCVEFSDNHWSRKILDQLKSEQGKPWLGLAWRQYLSWFCKTEGYLSKVRSLEKVVEWLELAEKNWLMLEDENVLMEEPRNTGDWLRPWRICMARLMKEQSR